MWDVVSDVTFMASEMEESSSIISFGNNTTYWKVLLHNDELIMNRYADFFLFLEIE